MNTATIIIITVILTTLVVGGIGVFLFGRFLNGLIGIFYKSGMDIRTR